MASSAQIGDILQIPELRDLLAVLNPEEDATRIVGGAVRNTLLGLPAAEIDLATKLVPQRAMALCQEAGFKVAPTGIEFGTVTAIVKKRPFEVTTLRKDIKTDGRHAVVEFGTSWEEDASRRDFTINALYLDAKGKVHAPIGGLDDLEARRVRFIGDARARIREDYLRIWRFFRFSAQYAKGPFDGGGLEACLKERAGLAQLSAERVHQELFKLLVAPRAAEAAALMSEMGLTVGLLGVQKLYRFASLGEADRVSGRSGDALERLAALAIWQEEDAERIGEKLRLSRAASGKLREIGVLLPQLRSRPDLKRARRLLYRHPQAYEHAVRVAAAQNTESEGQAWQQILDLPRTKPVPAFPLKGADLLEQGYESGPALGERLAWLEKKWIESDFTLMREQLLEDARAGKSRDL